MTFSLDLLEVDSAELGFSAWSLSGVNSAGDFSAAASVLSGSPGQNYVSCKLPIDRIDLINAAEDSGYSFIETQLQTSLRLPKPFDTSRYPYDYVQITTEEQLHEALYMAETTIEHDRFSRDPLVGRQVSGRRYSRFLRQSFALENEQIWCVRSRSSGRLLTFRSHRIENERDVTLLIGGVHPDFKDSGLGVISSHFCFSQLRNAGFRSAHTHISAANLPIVNLEIGHFGFRLVNTFVILRAII